MMLLNRCPLGKLKHIYTEETSLNAEQQLDEIAKICSEHLASIVELKWSLSTRFILLKNEKRIILYLFVII